jgi:hypothetical protein
MEGSAQLLRLPAKVETGGRISESLPRMTEFGQGATEPFRPRDKPFPARSQDAETTYGTGTPTGRGSDLQRHDGNFSRVLVSPRGSQPRGPGRHAPDGQRGVAFGSRLVGQQDGSVDLGLTDLGTCRFPRGIARGVAMDSPAGER